MPAHMTLAKPAKGTAQKQRRARKRAADAILAANAAIVRDRDRDRCVVCGFPHVQVHHIRFRSQGGKHETFNLVCLCAECHGLVHNRRIVITGSADDHLTITLRPPTRVGAGAG
jgi:5-methylcytosine-specific restriction endonuclease McrA